MQLSPDAGAVCSAAGQLARSPDAFECPQQTGKQQPWRTHPAFGARSEACNGFPHVLSVGLPVLRRARAAGVPEDLARVDALLAIISTLPDTCILRRGGVSALSVVQQGAKRVGDLGGSSTPAGSVALQMLERTMLELWVSPGGSADLLAATLFLDQLSSTWMSSAAVSSAANKFSEEDPS
jgi:triphosphoribosyl-dephospho-CoA synthase